MPLDVIVVMDPIAHIKIAKDTTFAMLLEAQRRGHRLHYVRPGGLSLQAGKAVAHVAPLQVRDDKADWFTLGGFAPLAFGPGQLVLMRKDPPFDGEYLYDTQILSLAQSAGALVVNDPQGLRDFNEKLAALLFPQC
jgi:glutathione synthase